MPAIPILLGTGKTTVINHVLSTARGRQFAAVVNDVDVINIDADLVTGASEGVFSLENGCVCCSLQGDMLRTIGVVLRQEPRPEGIVIEASGVSNPTDIVRSLLDPVIWQNAALDAVIYVVDARHVLDDPQALAEPLDEAQIRAGDFIALNKVEYGQVPFDALFSTGLHQSG